MDAIPYWFWMIIVAGLSGMLGLIMYYTAMLLRESTSTVREFKFILVEMHEILDSAKSLLEKLNHIGDTVSKTVETVSTTILQPLAVVGTWIASVKSLVGRFTGGGDDREDEEIDEREPLIDHDVAEKDY